MSIKISRILHAGYIFESENTQILFDPLFENPFSRNCYAFPAIEFDQSAIKNLKPSAIFISHYHDDHCSFDSLNLLDRSTPIYMYCIFEEMFSLIKELGFKQIYSLALNQPVQIEHFTITPYPALDEEVDCIFQIQTDNINILNVVDSWISDDILEKLLQTKWDSRIQRLDPGQTVILSSDEFYKGKELAWIKPIGDKDNDYTFNSYVTPPSTSEIAQHFSEISPEQKNYTLDYCQKHFLKKYNSLGSDEDYFNHRRRWRLSVYFKNEVKVFNYVIDGVGIQMTTDLIDADWSTEITAAKLYSALTTGESLSSLYVRINNNDSSVSILTDPLLRCLFNEEFASYQKAQLRKLRK